MKANLNLIEVLPRTKLKTSMLDKPYRHYTLWAPPNPSGDFRKGWQ